MAQRGIADGANAAFQFVENENKFFAGQRGAKFRQTWRLVGAEARTQLFTDDTPQRFEREVGELARDNPRALRGGKSETILGEPRLAFGGRTAQVQRDQQAVGFADALGTFGEKQSRLGLGGVQAFVDGLDEPADFTGSKSGLEEIAGAGFQGAVFRVRDALNINDTLKPTVENVILWFE